MGANAQTVSDRTLLTAARIATRFPYSAQEAADRFGISRSHLWGVLNGNARLGPDARGKIIEALRDEELDLADKICAEWDWVERV